MKERVHFIAAVVATLTIATFFVSTVLVEFLGSSDAVAQVKRLIVLPGLWILVPAIAATGGTGFALSKSRQGRLVDAKRKPCLHRGEWPMITSPCAIFLDSWASQSLFDARFYLVQGLELLAGGTNLVLMGLNMRDGLMLSGRVRPIRQGELTR